MAVHQVLDGCVGGGVRCALGVALLVTSPGTGRVSERVPHLQVASGAVVLAVAMSG
ncbi:hypothetical protein ACIQB4_19525 [Streptomyces griseoluteus]|uniref:hypothetical protein n=1 Tax=Streptomyces griseoluteus TaxID=29306 RepID=UPI003807C9D6